MNKYISIYINLNFTIHKNEIPGYFICSSQGTLFLSFYKSVKYFNAFNLHFILYLHK